MQQEWIKFEVFSGAEFQVRGHFSQMRYGGGTNKNATTADSKVSNTVEDSIDIWVLQARIKRYLDLDRIFAGVLYNSQEFAIRKF